MLEPTRSNWKDVADQSSDQIEARSRKTENHVSDAEKQSCHVHLSPLLAPTTNQSKPCLQLRDNLREIMEGVFPCSERRDGAQNREQWLSLQRVGFPLAGHARRVSRRAFALDWMRSCRWRPESKEHGHEDREGNYWGGNASLYQMPQKSTPPLFRKLGAHFWRCSRVRGRHRGRP